MSEGPFIPLEEQVVAVHRPDDFFTAMTQVAALQAVLREKGWEGSITVSADSELGTVTLQGPKELVDLVPTALEESGIEMSFVFELPGDSDQD